MPKTTLNLRIDSKLKNDAEKVAKELGLPMSTAITLFLKALVREKGLPFPVVVKPTKKESKGLKLKLDEPFDNHADELSDLKSLKDAIDNL
ncbi:MAG: type II toxin-antitoxin system RelB/DinJ family antitoxin [Bacilli bacterium]|nr:type II toxin-antitoxin system RelB/DinJ family antitoxin [Bacilli bacterium]